MTMGRMSELVGGELRLTAMGLNKQTSDLFRDGQAAHLVIGMMAQARLIGAASDRWSDAGGGRRLWPYPPLFEWF